MITHSFSGTYYEIGYIWGEKVKNFFQLPPASKETIQFANECLDLVKKYTPGISEMLDGFSEATKLDSELLNAFILALGRDIVEESRKLIEGGLDIGCTSFAISKEHTIDGSTYFARNYDWTESFSAFFTTIWMQPKDLIPSISFSDHVIGCYGGVNEEGLSMSIHGIPGYSKEWTPGIRMNVLSRWILDHFSNVKDAVKFIEKAPQICGHLFLLADKEDNIAKVEVSNEETHVEYPKNGFMAITNHYQDQTMKEKYELKNFRFENGYRRLKVVTKWFSEHCNDSISIDQVKEILSKHDDEGVCNHFEFAGEKTSTIWSWISALDKGSVLVADGSPCINSYKVFNIKT